MAFQPSYSKSATGTNSGNYRTDFNDGYLYYIRIKSDVGYFYKVGFTQSEDLNARFGFKENGDEKLIDYVFFVEYYPDAYKKEQFIHLHFNGKRAFPKYSNDPRFPFAGNGQSELYTEDILELDNNYSINQSKVCKYNILIKKGNSETRARNILENKRDGEYDIVVKILASPFLVLIFAYVYLERIIKFFSRLFDKTQSKEELKEESESKIKKEPAIDRDFEEFLIYIRKRYKNSKL